MPIRIKHFLFLLAAILGLFASLASAATSNDYYQAGLKLYNQHQYSQAARYFQAAVQVDPNNWQAYQCLGLCDYSLGDKEGARQAFDKSLQINPNNPSLARFDESLGGSSAAPQGSAASNSPIIGGGDFGIGLTLGGINSWGVSGKYWMDNTDAFQGAVYPGGGGTVLQLQYLWHDYDLIHPSHGAFPFYIGVGGDLALGGGVAVAGCVPVGLTYMFQKKSLPLDLFVEVDPTLWLYTGGMTLQFYANVGARFYF
jgi:tetratricopeptide (TPR) repeat protein